MSHRHVARLASEARASAFGAGFGVQVLGELFAHQHRIGFTITPFEIRQYAFKCVLAHCGLAALAQIGESDFFTAGAVEDQVFNLVGQLVIRRFEIKAVVLGQTLQHVVKKLIAPVPTLDRAGGER